MEVFFSFFLCVCVCFSGRSSVRQFSTFSEEKVAEESHAKSTMITWKRIVCHMQKGLGPRLFPLGLLTLDPVVAYYSPDLSSPSQKGLGTRLTG